MQPMEMRLPCAWFRDYAWFRDLDRGKRPRRQV
jgi:hypothetical protein